MGKTTKTTPAKKRPTTLPPVSNSPPPTHHQTSPQSHQQQQQQQGTPGGLLPLDTHVVYASSEDTPFPATELDSNSQSLRGWVSQKLCSYPQEVVFRFDGEVDLAQLQILAHECKIPSRVEVLVAGMDGHEEPPPVESAHFKRLGFLSFISNEKTKYRAREKKTVGLSAHAYYLKLVMHKCHMNALNNYNQVGLIQVQASGTLLRRVEHHYRPANHQQGLPPIRKSPTIPEANDTMDRNRVHFQGEALPPVQPPPRGNNGPRRPVIGATPGEDDYGYGAGVPQQRYAGNQYEGHFEGGYYDPNPALPRQQQQAGPGGQPVYRSPAILEYESWHVNKTRDLVTRKQNAVMDEDYDIAKICKEQLDRLQVLTNQIYEYESVKVNAIYEERFEDARAAKIRMDKLLGKAYALLEPDQQLRKDEEKYPRRKRQDSIVDSVDDQPLYPPGGAAGHAAQANVAHNDFDEQPVPSKYAQEMAEQAAKEQKKKPSPPRGKKPKRHDDEEEEEGDEEGEEAEEAEEQEEEAEQEEAEENEEAEDDDEHEKPPPAAKTKPKKEHKSRRQPDDDQQPIEAPPPAKTFDVEHMEEWEKAVFFAIQDEIGTQDESASDAPVDPRDAADHTTSVELKPILGSFATACLFSRRWKHREACLKVLVKLTAHLYQHQPTANVVTAVLKYMDLKGFGLLDPILVCFLSSCEFVSMVVEGRFPDCPLSAVQTYVIHLLPRLLLRSGDTTQKSREEALTLLLGCAKSPIGPEKVGAMVLADPIDADKKKIPPQNHRIHLSRLLVLQHILEEHGTNRGHLTVDAIMNKLLIPSLNHSNNELRELAINVIGCFDADAQQEAAKYMHLVSNAATKAAVDEKLAVPPPPRDGGDGEEAPQAAKHKRTKSGGLAHS